MRRQSFRPSNRLHLFALLGFLAALVPIDSRAQSNPNERFFPQPKAGIEKAIDAIKLNLAGRLPVLDGFANPSGHPLDRYQRGYYQASLQVTPVLSGGVMVRVSTKLTAWYVDPVVTRSEYQLLKSNGRIETDLLDLLAEQVSLGSTGKRLDQGATSIPQPGSRIPANVKSAVADPVRQLPKVSRFSPGGSPSLLSTNPTLGTPAQPNTDPATTTLRMEALNLEEVLKSQGHPKNLVAVNKAGTPVVAAPSLTAKYLFLASLHDEFELLDFNRDWVHVRISGLSRGWIWRNSVEMPDGISDSDAAPPLASLAAASDVFRVDHEERGLFPGTWEALRGRSVKILSIQKNGADSTDGSQTQRVEFAKFLFAKGYKELSRTPQDAVAGIVLIFDSADGGMIAAPLNALQLWKTGALSDAAFWHRCFFDPPDAFESSTTSAGQ